MANKGSYDDKIEAMLVARRRKAERKKMQRQKELQKIYTVIACGALLFLLILVIFIKGCSHNDDKKPKAEKKTTPAVTTVVETTTVAEETTTEAENVAGDIMYTTDTLNFRQEASVESELLMHIPPNTPVTVLSTDGEWCNISYNDVSGYVKLEYLRDATAEELESTAVSSDQEGEAETEVATTDISNDDTEEINITDDEDDDDILIENMDGDEGI